MLISSRSFLSPATKKYICHDDAYAIRFLLAIMVGARIFQPRLRVVFDRQSLANVSRQIRFQQQMQNGDVREKEEAAKSFEVPYYPSSTCFRAGLACGAYDALSSVPSTRCIAPGEFSARLTIPRRNRRSPNSIPHCGQHPPHCAGHLPRRVQRIPNKRPASVSGALPVAPYY